MDGPLFADSVTVGLEQRIDGPNTHFFHRENLFSRMERTDPFLYREKAFLRCLHHDGLGHTFEGTGKMGCSYIIFNFQFVQRRKKVVEY